MPRKSTNKSAQVELTPDQSSVIDDVVSKSNLSKAAWIRQAIREKMEREGVEFPVDLKHGGNRKST